MTTRVRAAVLAAAAAVSATASIQAVRPAQTPQDPLTRFEDALNAQPDDLRAGNDYRMAVVQIDKIPQYDRAIAFFEKLVTAHPDSSNAHLNYGFAYVDKIPAAGAITQVILANNALGEFTKSLELKPTWIGLYTRGNSYLFWPRIFNRTHLGIDDLQRALTMQKADRKRAYYARAYVALGDGFWKIDDPIQALNAWREGLASYPDNAVLKSRVSTQGDELKTMIEASYDPAKRVDTSLQDLWSDQ
jgi:tetratricopeptide (TPR) repeat protein